MSRWYSFICEQIKKKCNCYRQLISCSTDQWDCLNNFLPFQDRCNISLKYTYFNTTPLRYSGKCSTFYRHKNWLTLRLLFFTRNEKDIHLYSNHVAICWSIIILTRFNSKHSLNGLVTYIYVLRIAFCFQNFNTIIWILFIEKLNLNHYCAILEIFLLLIPTSNSNIPLYIRHTDNKC